MGEEEVLVGGHAIGGLVLLEGSSTTVVEEVDRDTSVTATVGGSERSVEVRKEVDVLAIKLARGQDTGHGDADIGLSVCCCHSVSD